MTGPRSRDLIDIVQCELQRQRKAETELMTFLIEIHEKNTKSLFRATRESSSLPCSCGQRRRRFAAIWATSRFPGAPSDAVEEAGRRTAAPERGPCSERPTSWGPASPSDTNLRTAGTGSAPAPTQSEIGSRQS